MKKSAISFFLSAFIIIVIIIALYIYLIKCYVAADWKETGVFGDSFGALTAFFSAMAFAGVIYSLLQQNKVLAKQEEEIKDNKELAKKQANLIKLQRFDGAFYSMLGMFNSMRSDAVLDKFNVYHGNNLGQNTNFRKVTGDLSKLKAAYNSAGTYSHILNVEFKKNFAQYLSSFESMVVLIVEESPQKANHLKYFFGQITNLEKICLLYHFHLGDRPNHFDEIKGPLFKSLRDFPNEVFSDHGNLFEGMKE